MNKVTIFVIGAMWPEKMEKLVFKVKKCHVGFIFPRAEKSDLKISDVNLQANTSHAEWVRRWDRFFF